MGCLQFSIFFFRKVRSLLTMHTKHVVMARQESLQLCEFGILNYGVLKMDFDEKWSWTFFFFFFHSFASYDEYFGSSGAFLFITVFFFVTLVEAYYSISLLCR